MAQMVEEQYVEAAKKVVNLSAKLQ